MIAQDHDDTKNLKLLLIFSDSKLIIIEKRRSI